MWYCAYIEVPFLHKYYMLDYDDIPISCHGGLSFSDEFNDKWYIGWDYAHYGDYIPDEEMLFDSNTYYHKWTPEEIELECYDVIDQLINVDDSLIKILYK